MSENQDPTNPESNPAVEGEPAADKASTPEERITALENEKKELRERMLRIAAEYDNYKKRTKREIADAELKAREALLKDTLEVVDNLERAVASISDSTSPQAVQQGVNLVLRFILQKLERHDVRPIDAKGKPFDPRFHEAISQAVTSEVPPGSVANERQRGYTVGDRLLRPALVEVAVAPPAASAEN